MNTESRIFVAGHHGLVGSAIARNLEQRGFTDLLVRSRTELDLRDFSRVRDFFFKEKPTLVFLAAAKVGGILANSTQPAEFIRENLAVQLSVIDAARVAGVPKLVFLGSSCIYPRASPQPIREEYFMSGPLEPTNAPYAIAKIAGIEMCRAYNRQYGTDYISVLPTNLYGPGDNFDLETSHVLPAMIRRYHEGKLASSGEVTLWGTGEARREFLHVDDLADACVHISQVHSGDELINIGCGEDVSIRELASIVRDVVGFEGETVWDSTKPDGMPRKLLDVRKLTSLGWKPRIGLRSGIKSTYDWFVRSRGSRPAGDSPR